MTQERVERIRQALEQAFEPAELDIEDQSHLHAGHPGARDGRGHFHVRIVADAFRGQPVRQRHRMVYTALADLLETDIHALGISASAPPGDSSRA